MYDGLRVASRSDADFASSVADLLASTSRHVIIAAGVIYLTWHLAATVLSPVELGYHVWLTTPVVVVTFVIALKLLDRSSLAAQVVWQAGLAAAVTLAIILFRRPEIAFLYALLPLMAVISVGRLAGLIAEALVIGLVALLSVSRWAPPFPRGYALSVVMGGGVAGLLGWAATHTLLTVAEWSLFYYEQANQTLSEARDQQVELKQTQEDLIQANRELARLSSRLKAAHQAAEEARQVKEAFVANVSHELRTPLNMIIGFSEMITQAPRVYGGGLPPALLADIAAIQRNSHHLAKLVNDVLDLSQIEADRMALSKEWVSLQTIISEATAAVGSFFDSKGLYLETCVAPDLPPLFCDATRIRQVLLNLLSNAGRFTAEGGVRVQASCGDGEVLVSVTDTGPGIPLEDRERLFEPFEQLDSSIRRQHGGSGLGLSISKRFIEMHQGKMWLESEVGVGTTIGFSLALEPQSTVSPPDDDARRWFNPYEEVGYRLRRRPSRAPTPVVGPRLVLLDEGRAMERLLERYADVELVHVPNAEAARQELSRSPAQALIVNAPLFSGLSAYTARLGDLPYGVPTITCWVPGETEVIKRLGVKHYLVKPIARATLLSAVESVGQPVKTVLLVDDEPDALRLFARMLSSSEHDYHVLRAKNGQRALTLLRQRQPDVVLLDLIMPGMDGFHVLGEKRRDAAIRDIPVVVTTSRDPTGRPIVSDALTVTRSGGLSARDLLSVIWAVSAALSPGPQPEHQGLPESSGA